MHSVAIQKVFQLYQTMVKHGRRICRSDEQGDDLALEAINWAIMHESEVEGLDGDDLLTRMVKQMVRLRRRREYEEARFINKSKFVSKQSGEESSDDDILAWFGRRSAPEQEQITMARQMLVSVSRLPKKHLSVLLSLGSGATPLDISAEMRMPVNTVLRMIGQAREWVHGGYLADFGETDMKERRWL